MVSYDRIVRELLELVQIELYGVGGVLHGGALLVSAFREGALNLYVYRDGGLERLNKGRVSFYAEPPYGSRRVVIARDVAEGREQHVLLGIRVDKPGEEEPLAGDMRPMRVFGLADDGRRVVVSASTEREIGVYAIEEGSSWKVVDLPGFAAVTHARGDIAVGFGALRGSDGSFQVFVVDIGRGELRIHDPPSGSGYMPVVAGDKVLYVLEGPLEARLMQLDPETMEAEPLELPGRDLEEFRPVAFNYLRIGPNGEVIAIARRNGRSAIFIDGHRIPAPEGMHSNAYILGDRVVATHTSLTTPHRVVEIDPETGEYRVLLEGRKPEWLGEALGGTGFEWVESFDGERVPTFILYSGRAPKPGPTVVLIHGGPFSEDADSWDVIAASLASLGLHVVMPNYRGSTGYGDEWRRKILGDPCGAELEDVTAAAEWARRSGLASRLYVMGYSYGGYLTLCSLVKKPGLYRAGVAGASVADWEEMYQLSDAVFRSFIEYLFAGRKELMRDRSPAAHVENLREPLCIVHPQNDSRTPLKPVLHFMEKASELGKRFEAHIAPDMGHTINTNEDAIKILLPALLFLARQEAEAQDKS